MTDDEIRSAWTGGVPLTIARSEGGVALMADQQVGKRGLTRVVRFVPPTGDILGELAGLADDLATAVGAYPPELTKLDNLEPEKAR